MFSGVLALFSDWVQCNTKRKYLHEDPTKRLYNVVPFKVFICTLFSSNLNRRVLLDELTQSSKRKHRRPAKYREMKAGELTSRLSNAFFTRVIRFSWHSRVFKPGTQRRRILRVEVSVLATLPDIKK